MLGSRFGKPLLSLLSHSRVALLLLTQQLPEPADGIIFGLRMIQRTQDERAKPSQLRVRMRERFLFEQPQKEGLS